MKRQTFGPFDVELRDGYAIIGATDQRGTYTGIIVSRYSGAQALCNLADFIRGSIDWSDGPYKTIGDAEQ